MKHLLSMFIMLFSASCFSNDLGKQIQGLPLSSFKNYNSEDKGVTYQRKSVDYDPHYNMCVTVDLFNHYDNKTVVAISARIYYGSQKYNTIDAEVVKSKVRVDPESSDTAFLFGNPKDSYKYMMMANIIVYFSDGTSERID